MIGSNGDSGKVVRLPVSAERSTRSEISRARSTAVSGAEFAKIIAPALTLTSPSGMTQDERKAWAHAAYKAIGDVPASELERAVHEAMKTADHPSKIVPAIRKALASGYQSSTTKPILPDWTPEPDTAERREQVQEMAGLMRDLRERLEKASAGQTA